jgi:DsbC/DsbD-like thiol-disulfide interchange protein
MHRIIAFILCGLLSLAFAACAGKDEKAGAGAANTSSNQNESAAGATKTPPADIVRAESESVEIAAGGAADAVVLLTIMDGYHINANPATLSYQIATQVNVEPSEGLTVGQPVYPSSMMRKFAFEPQPFAVYEGKASIKLPLKAEAGATKGAHTLKAKVRVQACDDQACYPPRTLNTSIPVNVK